MTCQLGYIRCVLTVGSHITYYYYHDQNVIVNNALILQLKSLLEFKI
jgi:hypothetical protein